MFKGFLSSVKIDGLFRCFNQTFFYGVAVLKFTLCFKRNSFFFRGEKRETVGGFTGVRKLFNKWMFEVGDWMRLRCLQSTVEQLWVVARLWSTWLRVLTDFFSSVATIPFLHFFEGNSSFVMYFYSKFTLLLNFDTHDSISFLYSQAKINLLSLLQLSLSTLVNVLLVFPQESFLPNSFPVIFSLFIKAPFRPCITLSRTAMPCPFTTLLQTFGGYLGGRDGAFCCRWEERELA